MRISLLKGLVESLRKPAGQALILFIFALGLRFYYLITVPQPALMGDAFAYYQGAKAFPLILANLGPIVTTLRQHSSVASPDITVEERRYTQREALRTIRLQLSDSYTKSYVHTIPFYWPWCCGTAAWQMHDSFSLSWIA